MKHIIQILILFASSSAFAAHPFYNEESLDTSTTLSKNSPVKSSILRDEKCFTGTLQEQQSCEPKFSEVIELSNERIYFERYVKEVCVRLFSAAGCPAGRGEQIYSIFNKSTGEYLGYEKSIQQRLKSVSNGLKTELKNRALLSEQELNWLNSDSLNRFLNSKKSEDWIIYLSKRDGEKKRILESELPKKSYTLYNPEEISALKLAISNIKIENIEILNSDFLQTSKKSGMATVDQKIKVHISSTKEIPFDFVKISCTQSFDKITLGNFMSDLFKAPIGNSAVIIQSKIQDDIDFPFRNKSKIECRILGSISR